MEIETSYIDKFKEQYYNPDARRKPVLLAALRSQGRVDFSVTRRHPDITETREPNRLGDEDSYAKSAALRFYVCQEGLFEEARRAKAIRAFLEDEMRSVLE